MSFPRYVRDWAAGLDIGVQFEDGGKVYPLQSRKVAEAQAIAPAVRWENVETARADLTLQIERKANALRAAIVGTTDAALIEVYRNKYEAALAGNYALLATEAAARGLTPEQLAAAVIAKGDAWRAAGQAVEAARAAHKAALALADLAACEAYDINQGWPV